MIIHDDHIWRSYMMVMYDDHISWSYMMIIYDDHMITRLSGCLLEAIWGSLGLSGSLLGALWRYSGGLGGHWATLGHPKAKCAKTYLFFCRKRIHQPFRMRGAKVGVTKYRACGQKLSTARAGRFQRPPPGPSPDRQNPYSQRAVWGNATKQDITRSF